MLIYSNDYKYDILTTFFGVIQGGINMIRDEERFEKDFNSASGNLIHEGMKFPDAEKELIKLRYLRKITEEEFLKRIFELAEGE